MDIMHAALAPPPIHVLVLVLRHRHYKSTNYRGPRRFLIFLLCIHRLDSTEFKVVVSSEDQVELSFSSAYTPSSPTSVHLHVDKRLVVLKGSSGFYCYAILEHARDWPALNVTEARLAFKLNTDAFKYMAVSDDIQRYMPSAADRAEPRGAPLAYKEAVLLVNPQEPRFRGEVDDKYQYSMDNKDSTVHGWTTAGGVERSPNDNPVVGFWVITPSNEFKSGGPTKRELTSHVGPTTLTMFLGTHYVGNDIVLSISGGEYWKKVMGPVFVYLNSRPRRGGIGGCDHSRALWADAKAQARAEAGKWPYSFPKSPDFAKAGERGGVTGRLLVRDDDRFTTDDDNNDAAAAPMPVGTEAYVGLAAPGQAGSWVTECKGYQFWTATTATEDGFVFTIANVREGVYSLYAWVPGVLGEYVHASPVTVAVGGAVVDLGDLVFRPPRSGPTLWEIGVPDRKAAEFFVPDVDPRFANRLFLHKDRYRQYGLWARYAELYPDGDPVFTVGRSEPWKDWFFAHVTRKVGEGRYAPTTREIRFRLYRVVADGTYTLRVSLAAAHMSRLQVRVNGRGGGGAAELTTPEFGGGNAIARHGIHGVQWNFQFPIRGYLLREGDNSVSITQTRADGEFLGVLYDYVRLEAPPAHCRDPTATATTWRT
uniref:Rhamnogalacturonan endolyase n=1 Tax=Zea mays TaxID=4577 RepID=A0A804PFM8_MAIZE